MAGASNGRIQRARRRDLMRGIAGDPENLGHARRRLGAVDGALCDPDHGFRNPRGYFFRMGRL